MSALLQAYGLVKLLETGCQAAEMAACQERALTDGNEVQTLTLSLNIYQSLDLS